MSQFTIPTSFTEQVALLKRIEAEIVLAKEAEKAAKEAAKAEKLAKSIARTEARLQKLLAKQVGHVGTKAIKANRRPSKAIVVSAEAVSQ